MPIVRNYGSVRRSLPTLAASPVTGQDPTPPLPLLGNAEEAPLERLDERPITLGAAMVAEQATG
jgi:hypothetical protein